MSLLSSFKNDFNAVIDVLSRTTTTDAVGQRQSLFTPTQSWIDCLIMQNSFKTDKEIKGWSITYYESTHLVRLELWPIVKVGDKIKNQQNVEYEVKFVYENPWFGGVSDHLVLYVDIINARSDTWP
jgi:hypothetical protein